MNTNTTNANSIRLGAPDPQPISETEVVLPDGTRIIERHFGTIPVLPAPWPASPPWSPGQGGGRRDCGCPTDGYVCCNAFCPRAVQVTC